MSLMLPFGTELFERAKRLKIMAASELLRPLPSMNLALDWGEGVAGQVWKDKLGAAAIVTDNSVIDFEAKGLTRISPTKRRSGNFGHKIGLCLPITRHSVIESDGIFLGVLCVGSDSPIDQDIFESREFTKKLYEFSESISEGVYLLKFGA